MAVKLKNTSERKLNRAKINNLMESIEKDPKLVKMFVNEAQNRGIYVNRFPYGQESATTRAGESQYANPYGSGSKYFTSTTR